MVVDLGTRKNAWVCRHVYEDRLHDYSPDEIKAFGFPDGREYRSIPVQFGDSLRNVFLERMINDENELYYFKDHWKNRFFILKDTCEIKELVRKSDWDTIPDYKEQLR